MEWEHVGSTKRPRKSLHSYTNSPRLNPFTFPRKPLNQLPSDFFANELLMSTSSPPPPPPPPSSSSSSLSSPSSSSGVTEASDLPCTILIDILGRLPLRTLIDCRYVCKSWRSLLTDPYFNRLYSHHLPTSLILNIQGNSLNTLREFYLIDHDSPFPPPTNGKSLLRKVSVTTSSSSSSSNSSSSSSVPSVQDSRYQLGNGCNGLVCIREVHTREPRMVWNPVMGQFVVLPKPTAKTDDKVVAGLGFCARTNRFKVLRVYHGLNDPPGIRRAEVYDLGVGKRWRQIEGVSFEIPSKIPGFFTNSSLHWILDDPNYKNNNMRRSNVDELICGFDFVEEKFKEVAGPPLYTEQKNKYIWSNLGIIAGCLSISGTDARLFRPDIQVWVMEEYGVPESWALRLSIRDPIIEWWDPYRWIQVTNVLKNGNVVLVCAHCYVLRYNVRDRKFEKEVCLGYPAIAHVPSFVSLEDVLGDRPRERSLRVRYL